MKPSRIFLSSRFSTARHLFHFFSIQQLVVHDTSPPRDEKIFFSSTSVASFNCYTVFTKERSKL